MVDRSMAEHDEGNVMAPIWFQVKVEFIGPDYVQVTLLVTSDDAGSLFRNEPTLKQQTV